MSILAITKVSSLTRQTDWSFLDFIDQKYQVYKEVIDFNDWMMNNILQ